MIATPPAAISPQTGQLGNMTVDFGFMNLVNYIQTVRTSLTNMVEESSQFYFL